MHTVWDGFFASAGLLANKYLLSSSSLNILMFSCPKDASLLLDNLVLVTFPCGNLLDFLYTGAEQREALTHNLLVVVCLAKLRNRLMITKEGIVGIDNLLSGAPFSTDLCYVLVAGLEKR